ncbi:MAG TPA: hypothetical protein VGF45_06285, partial [Polyangia bacterium]
GFRRAALLGMLDELGRAETQRNCPPQRVPSAARASVEASSESSSDGFAESSDVSERDALVWARQALEGGTWGETALRRLFDDALAGRSAIEAAAMQTFTAQLGFSHLEFFATAATASGLADSSFTDAITRAQAAEVRRARQGAAALRVLVEQDHAEVAQRLVDVGFWRSWRLLCLTTGQALDYHLPLVHRTRSVKRFVNDTIVDQLATGLLALGLERPWYWDQFRRSVDSYHHGMHLGIWSWRQSGGFPQRPAVDHDERDWLESEYPGWNDSFGRCWDAIAESRGHGYVDGSRPMTTPVVCSLCSIPIVGVPGAGWSGAQGTRSYTLTQGGRCHSFCSEVCRWIFELDPKRYGGHLGFLDRTLGTSGTSGISGTSHKSASGRGR